MFLLEVWRSICSMFQDRSLCLIMDIGFAFSSSSEQCYFSTFYSIEFFCGHVSEFLLLSFHALLVFFKCIAMPIWLLQKKFHVEECLGNSFLSFYASSIGDKHIMLSEDHRITSLSERTRLISMGSPIQDGETRLCGNLVFFS